MTLREESVRLIFGLKLKQLRLDHQISLADLSKKTGISISYLNEIEKAKKYPKSDKIFALASAFDVNYDWLVSLQLSKNLSPVAELIKSNILYELPLEMFGLEPGDLLELLIHSPTKLSAFVSTLIEISRNYGMSVEHFYFSALRSYQEMYENYFDEIEQKAIEFKEEEKLKTQLSADKLKKILLKKYNYEIKEDGLRNKPELREIRSVLIPGANPKLLLNPELDETQKAFQFGKEIGFNKMALQERPYTSTWLEVESFEQVLNNYKASYFSSAILMEKDPFLKDLEKFFNNQSWKQAGFLEILEKYNATPEMFMQRLTNLLPKFFNINKLFFLRFSTPINSGKFYITKEMHLSGLHNPHATALDEHYCRRWVSLTILKELQYAKINDLGDILCRVQRSTFLDTEQEYLLFALAKPSLHQGKDLISVSIGMLLDENVKTTIKFWNDPKIPHRSVNTTCERCSAVDCQERKAPPLVLEKEDKQNKIKKAIDDLYLD
jgi:XRE family transcriptional regulator, fatty acid utilization regulator